MTLQPGVSAHAGATTIAVPGFRYEEERRILQVQSVEMCGCSQPHPAGAFSRSGGWAGCVCVVCVGG